MNVTSTCTSFARTVLTHDWGVNTPGNAAIGLIFSKDVSHLVAVESARAMTMNPKSLENDRLSPWWQKAVILVMVFGFTLLTIVTVKTYNGAPPIPARVVNSAGQVLFHGGRRK